RVKRAGVQFCTRRARASRFTQTFSRGIPMKKTLLSISLVSLFTALAGSALALEQRPVLSLDVAKKMAAACEAKAKQEGWKMNIAIVDNGGNLKLFLREDDAFLKSIEI